MDCRIIKSPGEGTLAILNRRNGSGPKSALETPDAVGLTVEDIRGSCPQNMILLAIFGDTASVESAIEEIKRKDKERKW